MRKIVIVREIDAESGACGKCDCQSIESGVKVCTVFKDASGRPKPLRLTPVTSIPMRVDECLTAERVGDSIGEEIKKAIARANRMSSML